MPCYSPSFIFFYDVQLLLLWFFSCDFIVLFLFIYKIFPCGSIKRDDPSGETAYVPKLYRVHTNEQIVNFLEIYRQFQEIITI